MLKKILDLIYPKRCIFCNEIVDYFQDIEVCKTCYKKLPYKAGKKELFIRKETGNYYNELICVFDYVEPVKKAIAGYKYNDKKRYADTFVKIIQNSTKSATFFRKFDIIISVPLHPNKLKERGYNQSYLITKRISEKYKIEEKSHLLDRVVHTRVQSKLKKADRIINVREAFKINKEIDLNNRPILVFDDILTTGATLNACCKQLKNSGAGKITAFVIASGL